MEILKVTDIAFVSLFDLMFFFFPSILLSTINLTMMMLNIPINDEHCLTEIVIKYKI